MLRNLLNSVSILLNFLFRISIFLSPIFIGAKQIINTIFLLNLSSQRYNDINNEKYKTKKNPKFLHQKSVQIPFNKIASNHNNSFRRTYLCTVFFFFFFRRR
eukprot:TRINITY_DN12836_c2_g1_i3.p8 TRINITY_DN12836_c2_g1~~TRINITY_DN12836_c2_g1_i3.p8  ORF type:complete len:102 (+),score=2.39 TRINITY_DN12836_c2_g1_i3:1221-1526(+)